MSTIRVNGKEIELEAALSLQELLRQEGFDAGSIAVEKNGHIVAKAAYATEMLSGGDKLEIVRLVGGG